MTIDPTPKNIAYVIARIDRAEKDNTLERFRSAAFDARELLRALQTPSPKVEPVLPPETYTAAGLPRRAAARARENWAVITYLMDAIQVEFPNGSRVIQRTNPYTRHSAHSPQRWGRLERFNGAAPGAAPPKGGTIEEILNNYADEKEGRT